VKCADCGEPREISAYAASVSSSCRRCRKSVDAISKNPRGVYKVTLKPLRYERSIAFKYPELAKRFADDSPTPPDLAAYSTQRGMKQKVRVSCVQCGRVKEVSAYAAVMSMESGCAACGQSNSSKGEEELAAYVTSLGHEVVLRDREVLGGRELDVYMPKLRCALEYNGDYWHSDEVMMQRGTSAEEYHAEKLRLAADQDVRLGFVWESEWRDPESKKILIASISELLSGGSTPQALLKLRTPLEDHS